MSIALNIDYQNSPSVMPVNGEVKIIRFGDLTSDTFLLAQRYKYDIVIWSNKGKGTHQIDFKNYDLLPGKLFFVRAGQLHKFNTLSDDGWMIMLRNGRIGQRLNGLSVVDVGHDLPDTCRGLFSLLQAEISQGLTTLEIIEPILSAIVAGVKPKSTHLSILPNDLHIATDLENLISKNFKTERYIYYYSKMLGIGMRKLNSISRDHFGFTVYELLHNRLLGESQEMLASSRKSVKEIAYELGFEDPAYFCRWFRKHNSKAPLEYRRIAANER